MKPKPQWLYNQAGSIPFKIDNGNVFVILIRKTNKCWSLPKGVIDGDKTDIEIVVNEAWEEAGIKGIVCHDIITTAEISKWGDICKIKLFPLKITTLENEFPEAKKRERKWFSLNDAVFNIRNEYRAALKIFSDYLKSSNGNFIE